VVVSPLGRRLAGSPVNAESIAQPMTEPCPLSATQNWNTSSHSLSARSKNADKPISLGSRPSPYLACFSQTRRTARDKPLK
jgi:hypothetical protein